MNLLRRLGNFLDSNPIGLAIPLEAGLQIFPDRIRRIPRPDGGFIANGRLRGNRMPRGFLTVAPDGELDGEDVIPGFRCALVNIMPTLGDEAEE